MLCCSEVIRSPPSRPEVTLDKVKVSNRIQAVHTLIQTDPQMVQSLFENVGAILVMTKAAGVRLQQELTSAGKRPHFFHSGLDPSQKETIHLLIGRELVIATTGTDRTLYLL
jgi:superfamily II DNA helicase RecQ